MKSKRPGQGQGPDTARQCQTMMKDLDKVGNETEKREIFFTDIRYMLL